MACKCWNIHYGLSAGILIKSQPLRRNRIPLAFRGALLLLLVVAVLHTLDRQGEFVSRTDFLWKAKLKVEQEEVETMRGINKVSSATALILSVRDYLFIITEKKKILIYSSLRSALSPLRFLISFSS